MLVLIVATLAVSAAGSARLVAQAAAAVPSGCTQSGLNVTCTYTTGANAFAVPDGVTTLHVVAVGGSGGSTANEIGVTPGGFGARVTDDLSVTPGSTLYAVVGGNGCNDVGAWALSFARRPGDDAIGIDAGATRRI